MGDSMQLSQLLPHIQRMRIIGRLSILVRKILVSSHSQVLEITPTPKMFHWWILSRVTNNGISFNYPVSTQSMHKYLEYNSDCTDIVLNLCRRADSRAQQPKTPFYNRAQVHSKAQAS